MGQFWGHYCFFKLWQECHLVLKTFLFCIIVSYKFEHLLLHCRDLTKVLHRHELHCISNPVKLIQFSCTCSVRLSNSPAAPSNVGKSPSRTIIYYTAALDAILYLSPPMPHVRSFILIPAMFRGVVPLSLSLYFWRSDVIDARRCVFEIAKTQRSALFVVVRNDRTGLASQKRNSY